MDPYARASIRTMKWAVDEFRRRADYIRLLAGQEEKRDIVSFIEGYGDR